MNTKHYEDFLAEIGGFLKKDQVYTDELRTLGWGTDAGFYRLIPQVVVRSDGEEQLSRIVKACRKHGLPFTFRAAGTSLSGQSVSDSVLIVSIGRSMRSAKTAAASACNRASSGRR